MRNTALAYLASAALLAGCATTQEPPVTEDPPAKPPMGECNAEAAQDLVGTKASDEVGQRLLELTGAKTLRWGPPRSAMTMDFRGDRLTVAYDDDMVITRISCG